MFWQVGSSATLGTNSVFVGTVLALTSVAATTGATVQGRLLARNAEVTLDTNVITASNCASAPPATTTTTAAAAATTTVATITSLPRTGSGVNATAAVALLAVVIGSAMVFVVARRGPSAARRG